MAPPTPLQTNVSAIASLIAFCTVAFILNVIAQALLDVLMYSMLLFVTCTVAGLAVMAWEKRNPGFVQGTLERVDAPAWVRQIAADCDLMN